MAMGDELWFRDVRSTPERERVYAAMCADDEGLGPRAYRCLLQLADGRQPTPDDVAWLTAGVERPSLARLEGARCVLTAHGRLLARAADAGDVEAMFALTTMPELLEGRAVDEVDAALDALVGDDGDWDTTNTDDWYRLHLTGARARELAALRARVRELTEGCATLREQLRDLSGYCSEQEYLARRGEAVDAENADLRRRVAELEAEVAALRATATAPPWRAGPRA